jgi:predicted neutral ceramidase superfamily lipid hydrolase
VCHHVKRNPVCFAECLTLIAAAHGLSHLSPEERYQQLADVTPHEIACVDRRLISNISTKVDEEAWMLHASDAYSVAMRVCSHKVDIHRMQVLNQMQYSVMTQMRPQIDCIDAMHTGIQRFQLAYV